MTADALGQALEVPAGHGTERAYRRCPDRCGPCRDAHAAYRRDQRARRLRPAAQPCGHCGRLVLWRAGRITGRTWWHGRAECRRERDRVKCERYHQRRRVAS